MSTTATPTAGSTTASRRTATDRRDIPTAAGSSTDRTERPSRPPSDTDGDRVRARLRGERLVAPHLIEVVSAWRRLAAAGDVDERRVALAMGDLGSIRLDRVPHVPLVGRCWELRQRLTVSHATYVALAEAVDVAPLPAGRSEGRRVGKECVSPGKSRWSRYHYKKKK